MVELEIVQTQPHVTVLAAATLSTRRDFFVDHNRGIHLISHVTLEQLCMIATCYVGVDSIVMHVRAMCDTCGQVMEPDTEQYHENQECIGGADRYEVD